MENQFGIAESSNLGIVSAVLTQLSWAEIPRLRECLRYFENKEKRNGKE